MRTEGEKARHKRMFVCLYVCMCWEGERDDDDDDDKEVDIMSTCMYKE